ncbi:DUF6416 domain-containing protein [Nocardioides sp. Root140]|uniref:DUF6416 domain-containing protein n=1 Tax=Nocardioides sp. Root140 TaxID=1736460 RepID=UPI00070162B6|nr:DUF6416 domain-containing protein [Nocardioides sp. Root140]KQY61816.1 hypothetical protein ASD30_25065 [Nocardioides sp. Root140]
MPDVTVPVPDDRVAEFYGFFSAWLAGEDAPASPAASVAVAPWGQSDDDLGKAQVVWSKLSERATAMFELLLDEPGNKVSGEEIADRLGIPNGKYGVAGVLAWPGRHANAVGRPLPVQYDDGPVGGSASYWIAPATAAIFNSARSAINGGEGNA